MKDIYDYIAEEIKAPENAIAQYNRIADAVLSLDEYPDRFRMVVFEPEHSQGLHQMIVDNYLIFYLIKDREVIVTNVLYSASNIENRLR